MIIFHEFSLDCEVLNNFVSIWLYSYFTFFETNTELLSEFPLYLVSYFSLSIYLITASLGS